MLKMSQQGGQRSSSFISSNLKSLSLSLAKHMVTLMRLDGNETQIQRDTDLLKWRV
jgi:hypothetical protein